jgi:cell division protein FtsB
LLSEFEAKFAQQQKQIETLSARVQKLSEQVELSRSMPQLADNSR